ncbi:V4R domain-containing protein [Phormidium sp. CCY1219]|uniref:V4R domain-containing protein n=1 Tax=Phormidium sp. CCY1219 TaxID=2886104 RepID=UPI002D1F95C8|nr:V4R domain-containing protein [Phormidium sp. CCY1219]MEB3828916.1 4-vinyl reductase [Phormidium sp. CCY1219]
MISISNLVKDKHLPGNYFAYDVYVRGDLELGLLENRRGDRLLAVPETLIDAIYAGLEEETGSAARLVLFNCGKWWGKNFYVRFCEEINEYYGKPIAEMEMVEFLQCLQQLWKTNGWGILNFNQEYYDRGFLAVKTKHSPYTAKAPNWKRPVCFLEAGILSAYFSQLTGRDLHCVQTACESLGAEFNIFVLGLSDRLKPAEAWVAQGEDHDTIMTKLCEG